MQIGESPMDRNNFNQDYVIVEPTRTKTRQPAKKSRWREIEAIQDQKRLEEELQQFDYSTDFDD